VEYRDNCSYYRQDPGYEWNQVFPSGAFSYESVEYRKSCTYYRQDPGYGWNQGLSLFKYKTLLPKMLG